LLTGPPRCAQEATPRSAAPALTAASRALHRRAKSESAEYQFGWETESDEEGDGPKSDDAPSPVKPTKRSTVCAPSRGSRRLSSRADVPAFAQVQAQASPQRHRRTVSAHARREEPPVTPRAAVAEAAVVTVLEALRGHAGAALIISLCVLLSLTVRPLCALASLGISLLHTLPLRRGMAWLRRWRWRL
jgi:hypothetical protein